PRQDVEMEVRHRLPPRLPVRLQNGDAAGMESGLRRARDPRRGPEDRAGQIVVEVENRFAMRLHRHDDVTRVDLTDIHEGERKLVLVDLGRWDLAGDDPAEDAIAHVASLAQGPRIQMTD